MSLFKRKPKARVPQYDPATQQPAVRKSICTGEMTAGFIDLRTGKFMDVMRVDGRQGLEDFKREIGADEIKEIY